MDKKKILLVDDEVDFLEIMGVRIESWGYDLIKASNGKEAIDAVMSKTPDIVILDYIMPDMDGIEVLKQIRKIDNKIPVIMFTAHPDMKSMKGAEELGIIVYTPKLSAYIDTQLSLKQAIRMAEKRLGKKE